MTDLRASQLATEVALDQVQPVRTTQVVAEVLAQPNNATVRTSQLAIEVLTTCPASDVRATQVVAEVVAQPNNATVRTSQLAVEVLVRLEKVYPKGIESAQAFGTSYVAVAGTSTLRSSQVAVEVALKQSQPIRTTQVVAEVVAQPDNATVRTSQLAIEVLTTCPASDIRATQVVAEVLAQPNNATIRTSQLAIEVLRSVASPQAISLEDEAINSAEAFGTAIVLVAQKILPSSIASAEAFGTTKVNQKVEPSAIGSAEAFGTTKVNLSIKPSAIGSAEAFGEPSIFLTGDQTVYPESIGSAEAFGTAKVNMSIQPSGVASAEAFGTTKVNQKVVPSGIASAEAFGTAIFAHVGPQIVYGIDGIASAEAFGTTIVRRNIKIIVSAISSAETFGTVIIGAGELGVANLSGIATISAIGKMSYAAQATLTGEATILAVATTNKTWDGANSDWDDPNNWAPNGVPGLGDNVFFDGSNTTNCNFNDDIAVNSLTIESSYTGIITASTFAVDVTTAFIFDGNILNMGDAAWTIGEELTLSGTVVNAENAQITTPRDIIINSGTYNSDTEIITLTSYSSTTSIDFDGNSINELVIDSSSATKVLASAFEANNIIVQSGIFDSGGFDFGYTAPGTLENHGTIIVTGLETIVNINLDDSDGVVTYETPSDVVGLNLGYNYYDLNLNED